MLVLASIFATSTYALDFGDEKSATLTIKAWNALGEDQNTNAVAYANKCIALYEKDAVNMQKKLKAPVDGDDDAVRAKWALNDVGTCYYIIGKAHEKLGDTTKATTAYTALISKLAFAQCWDPQGWFWTPAEAAQERLDALAPAAVK